MQQLDIQAKRERIQRFEPYPVTGRVTRIGSGEIIADGPDISVGTLCDVTPDPPTELPVKALAAAVSTDRVALIPMGNVERLKIGNVVRALPDGGAFPVGDGFAGRAINALANPIDGLGPAVAQWDQPKRLEVLDRVAPSSVFATGVRAIDGLLTVGVGQRVGILAASGVGKTRLINQILRRAGSERIVICLVGERGREVEELWRSLAETGDQGRCTVVAATSDETAPMRARVIEQGLALAEHWRQRGEDVLLVVDSITRLAMALREIGLIAGEPPTARAYTPNVFRALPQIVERCGAARGGGSITAIFTVLCETDDADDPLVETMKSLLDGHIVLSRDLAQAGHFPAIDIGRSISRLFDSLVDRPHRDAARLFRARIAKYEQSGILIESGLYKPGADPDLDLAIAQRGAINGFLQQSDEERANLETARSALIAAVGGHG
ncbi:MAG: FliI/YscN family ATPase [Sphingomonadales bacterium]|nr:FliI/YscN family ATPase [Sphingomonadales bacterium]